MFITVHRSRVFWNPVTYCLWITRITLYFFIFHLMLIIPLTFTSSILIEEMEPSEMLLIAFVVKLFLAFSVIIFLTNTEIMNTQTYIYKTQKQVTISEQEQKQYISTLNSLHTIEKSYNLNLNFLFYSIYLYCASIWDSYHQNWVDKSVESLQLELHISFTVRYIY